MVRVEEDVAVEDPAAQRTAQRNPVFEWPVVDAYPELTVEDVNAVIHYAAEALQNDVLIEVQSAREVP